MSVPSNVVSYLNPTIAVDQSIYEESTTQKTRLGTALNVGDRKFKYAVAGAALSAGDILANAANTQVVNATAGAAASIGDKSVTIYGAAAITAGVFNEGVLIVSDDTGLGYAYRIKNQPACSSAGTAVVTLYDPLAAALAVTSEITCVPNPNKVTNVITATTPLAGIAPCAVTSGNYFWAQTEGLASVKVLGTVAFGSIIVPSTTGGAAVIDATANVARVGVCLAAGTTGDTVPVLLELARR